MPYCVITGWFLRFSNNVFVAHSSFLKLSFLSSHIPTLRWFSSYHSSVFPTFPLNAGVPQGSDIGLLFSLYTPSFWAISSMPMALIIICTLIPELIYQLDLFFWAPNQYLELSIHYLHSNSFDWAWTQNLLVQPETWSPCHLMKPSFHGLSPQLLQ